VAAFQTCFLETLGSNFIRHTDYPDGRISWFRDSASSLDMTTSFHIHSRSSTTITLPYDAVQHEPPLYEPQISKEGVLFLTRLGASFPFSHFRSSAVISHMKTFRNTKTRLSKEEEEKIYEYKQDDKQENLSNLSPPFPTTSQPFSINQTHNQQHIQTPHHDTPCTPHQHTENNLPELRCRTEIFQSIPLFL
jgi:hypothetical protein